ncbi:hypothetical protein ABW21_db0201622 [Orbilia brochopaga]|nr:hypothetical protein ABW21_db0201622 [Drechslerella brochopaga]
MNRAAARTAMMTATGLERVLEAAPTGAPLPVARGAGVLVEGRRVVAVATVVELPLMVVTTAELEVEAAEEVALEVLDALEALEVLVAAELDEADEEAAELELAVELAADEVAVTLLTKVNRSE